jgi:guanidinobutyrase
MRLPQQQTADGLDACFIGVPLDIGTSNRSGCRGPNLVGCDLVEVSPPYDPSGNTALMAANLLFEMLSVLPGAVYH